MEDVYQDVNLRSSSPLILYDGIVVSALFKHATFDDSGDDRSNRVVEVIDDSERIGQHRSHVLQVRKPFRHKVIYVNLHPSIEEQQCGISFTRVHHRKDDW